MNPYQCPSKIYEIIRQIEAESFSVVTTPDVPLLRAVVKLGPGRVRWLGFLSTTTSRKGTGKVYGGKGMGNSLTCWALDGKRTEHNALLRAAGLTHLILTGPPDTFPPRALRLSPEVFR